MTNSLLIVSVDFLPNVGGISMMTHHLANAFASDMNVRVLAPRGASELPELPARYELVVDEESQVKIREGDAYQSEIARIEALLATLHAEKPLEAILLMHPFYYGYAAMTFGRKQAITVGCYFHGFELKSQLLKAAVPAECKGRSALAWRDLRHSTIELVRQCDALFVNSSVTARLVVEEGRKDVCVTGCGLDQQFVDKELLTVDTKKSLNNLARAELGWRSDAKYVGYFGRITPSKNIEFLIEMLVEQKEWQFAFAGVVSDRNYAESLSALATKLGVQDRVAYLGELSEEMKWCFLTALDLFCLPSRMLDGGQMEGFGIVLLEATLKGTPVVVSTTGGMRDFVLDNNGLYLDGRTPTNAGNFLDEFLADEERVRRTVQNAQNFLTQELTYDRIAARIERKLIRP